MKLIVGLGNPGKQYEYTRHNVGFLAVDFYLRGKEKITCHSKFHGQICEMHFTAHPSPPHPSISSGAGSILTQPSSVPITIGTPSPRGRKQNSASLYGEGKKEVPPLNKRRQGGVKVFFIKPLSFMNKSGEVVKAVCNFYKVDPAQDLLIIHDDKDLKLGYHKVTLSSSGAGHNGVQSIIDELRTQGFARVRIGIESRLNTKIPTTEDFVLQKLPPEELAILQSQIFPQVNEEIGKFILGKK